MKNFSNRDKLLLLLLPALVVGLGYIGWVGFRKQKALLSKREEVAKARETPPPRDVIRQQQFEVDKLTRDIARYRQDEEAARQAWESLVAKCSSPELRNERIEKLSSLLKTQRLVLIDDAEAEGGKFGKLPAVVDALGKLMNSKGLKPQLRQLHFYGGYPEVHNVLLELTRGEVLAVPVGLTMKASLKAADKHEWTLLVWI